MRTTPLLPSLCLAAFCWLLLPLVAPSPLRADPKWEQPTWKVPPKQYDVVRSIDAAAKMVRIEHVGGTVTVRRALKVDAFTVILIQDKKATLADLKPDMRVNYTLGGSGDTLSRLAVVEPPPPPPTPVPTVPPSFPKGR